MIGAVRSDLMEYRCGGVHPNSPIKLDGIRESFRCAQLLAQHDRLRDLHIIPDLYRGGMMLCVRFIDRPGNEVVQLPLVGEPIEWFDDDLILKIMALV